MKYDDSLIKNKELEISNVELFNNKKLIQEAKDAFDKAEKNKKKIPIEEKIYKLELKQIDIKHQMCLANIKLENCVDVYEYKASLCGAEMEKCDQLLKLNTDRCKKLEDWVQVLQFKNKNNSKKKHIDYLVDTISMLKTRMSRILDEREKYRQEGLRYTQQYALQHKEQYNDSEKKEVNNKIAKLSPQETLTNKDIFAG